MGDLLEQQYALQSEAHLILQQLNLLDFLSGYGQPRIVGSLALGLMTWPDIDLDLETVDPPSSEAYLATVAYLFDQPGVEKLILIDNRCGAELDRPLSIYLGVEYQTSHTRRWKIDLRFVQAELAYAQEAVEKIRSKLTAGKRLAILRIKQVVAAQPGYGSDIASVDIYRAVLEHGVTDLEGFTDYLHLNQSLDRDVIQ